MRFPMCPYPGGDCPYPDVGVVVAPEACGRGLAAEAIGLLAADLFDAYPVERVAATTDTENVAAQRARERAGFSREGVLRRASFRDGRWVDLCVYAIPRKEPSDRA